MGKSKIYGKNKGFLFAGQFLYAYCYSVGVVVRSRKSCGMLCRLTNLNCRKNLLHLIYIRCGLKQRFTVNLKKGMSNYGTKDVCTFRLVDQNGLPLPENEFRLEWRIKMTKRSGGVWEKVFCKDTVHTEARIELTPAFFEGIQIQ